MATLDDNAKTDFYAYRVKHYSELADHYHQLSIRLSFMRLGIIALLIVGFYFLLQATLYLIIAWVIFSIIMFLYVVIRHRRSDLLKQKAQILSKINQNELDVLNGGQNLYQNGASYSTQTHSYAHDLDVIGPFSLYHTLNRTTTYHGGQELADYVLASSNYETILSRKEAVRELEEQIEFRQELGFRLFEVTTTNSNPIDDIKRLLSHDLIFVNQFILKAYYMSLPLIWLLLALGYPFGSYYVQTIAGWIAGVNLIIAIYHGKKVNRIQSNISSALRLLGPVNQAIKHIFSNNYNAAYLNDMISNLRNGDNQSKVDSLHKLKKIIDFLDYRLNLLVGTILNIVFLWDLRILKMLSDWKKNNSHSIEGIFLTLGRVEAVSSLSNWSYNNDQFAYAEIKLDQFVVNARELHHPLLIGGNSISNSISINQQEHVTIVTGSNMAGKSTFLRTIGANMVLAYAGTRVIGKSLNLSIVKLITYMRIKDNLEESVSTFKAELNRVSMILEELSKEQDCFVLIDEMLRGTNSVDKLTGSIAITKKLIEYETHAMIATHDIQLAQLERTFPTEIQNYYFDIALTNNELEFDYKLKKGICDTFNASYLLRALDLDVPDHDKSLSTK